MVKKCNKLGVYHLNVEEFVVNFGLLHLCDISYEYARLISVFGEMSVTLDYTYNETILSHCPSR